MFGKKLNSEIEERLQRELDAINGNGYAGLYLMWKKLIEKSQDEGYPTMSRGSVGSSLTAYLCGITDINPLSEENGGYNIPEETFMGINLNKIPDININFANGIQEDIQDYADKLPGVFITIKAGYVATYDEFSLKRKINGYYENKGIPLPDSQNYNWMKNSLCGVKRGDGIHPGGIMIIPEGEDVYTITPLRRTNDLYNYISHFEYHYLEDSILKFDILSLRYLDRLHFLLNETGIKLEDIPLNDEKVILKLCNKRIKTICDFPEFGNEGTRKIIFETNPKSFNDFVKISALSHGTDVWNVNVNEKVYHWSTFIIAFTVWKDNQNILIKNKTITLGDCIASRDDIMIYLIDKGIGRTDAYDIMKSVYRGKGIKNTHMEMLKESNVPDWYIDVCKKIKYLFPKAHAVSYTKMAFQMAYFLVYYPNEYRKALEIQ